MPEVTTIQDVARAAGVSPASVSNVLNGRHDRMRAETLARIQGVVAALGYRPNAAARQLKTGRSPVIGLLVPSVANPFYGELAVVLEGAAAARGYRALLCNTRRDAAREREFSAELAGHGVRGVLAAPGFCDPDVAAMLVGRGVAVVAIDARRADLGGLPVDVVATDKAAAAATAVDHLVALGHRRIVHVTGPPVSVNRQDRLRGFHAALVRHRLDAPDAVLVDDTPGPAGGLAFDEALAELGRRAAARLLARATPPTAVLALNDTAAIGLAAGLREAGFAVPRDMSLVGADDIALAHLMHPPLTTVRQPLPQMAEAAIERLLLRLAGDDGPAVDMVFAPVLVVRASTAAPRCGPAKRPPAPRPRSSPPP